MAGGTESMRAVSTLVRSSQSGGHRRGAQGIERATKGEKKIRHNSRRVLTSTIVAVAVSSRLSSLADDDLLWRFVKEPWEGQCVETAFTIYGECSSFDSHNEDRDNEST